MALILASRVQQKNLSLISMVEARPLDVVAARDVGA
jgi:hypothetical protein